MIKQALNTTVAKAVALVFASLAVACGPTTANSATGGVPDAVPTGDPAETSGAGPIASDAPEALKGPKAQDFTLPTLDGDSISLSDYEGEKVVLIDFWSTTCDPCLQEMPELIEVYNERKAKGFEILAISTDGPETLAAVQATVSKVGMNFPILLDEETEVMDRYNPKGELPMTLVVDRHGTVVLKRSSYTPGDKASAKKLVDAIDRALVSK